MVGAVALGSSGNCYVGASQDFQNNSTCQCIHAEQSVVAMAFLNQEQRISKLAVNAAPCGYCRQFLFELDNAASLEILEPGKPKITLEDLLPRAFSPSALGVKGGMLNTGKNNNLKLKEKSKNPLVLSAFESAKRSYSPYWPAYAGVALQTYDKQIFVGSYLDNVAQSPALAPLQVALVHLVQTGHYYSDIEQAVLVESPAAPVQQHDVARMTLHAVNPSVELSLHELI